MRDFGVIVIGAGVAGATAAMIAGRFGHRVAVRRAARPGRPDHQRHARCELAGPAAQFVVTCASDVLPAPAVIVAAGSRLRDLGLPGEAALLGRALSHDPGTSCGTGKIPRNGAQKPRSNRG
jgi:thioredoxin reductase